MNLLLEIIVMDYVLCCVNQLEFHLVAAVIARGKLFPIHASHFMLLSVLGVVQYLINSRIWYFFSGPENGSCICHNDFLSFPPLRRPLCRHTPTACLLFMFFVDGKALRQVG
jgi:hypothetical protein